MAAHRVGATVVALDRFDAEAALAAIEQHGVTHSQWVPAMFQRLLALPDDVRSAYDLSSHRVAIHGAAPCPVELKRALFQWWGPIIWEYYSATERLGVTSISPQEWLERPGSVGRAVAGTPHICDEDGNELPAGETGTIWFEDGPSFTYHHDPDQTAASTDHRGWRTVHDRGHLDADGYLYLSDRRSDLIITGGVNVYPREIELALLEHPDVSDAGVVGVDDDRFGQVVAVCVERRPGSTLVPADVRDHCAGHLATFKQPKRVLVVDVLPRTDTGKARRGDLRHLFTDRASTVVTTKEGNTR
jgi:fatty-acyl-CoA synthase